MTSAKEDRSFLMRVIVQRERFTTQETFGFPFSDEQNAEGSALIRISLCLCG